MSSEIRPVAKPKFPLRRGLSVLLPTVVLGAACVIAWITRADHGLRSSPPSLSRDKQMRSLQVHLVNDRLAAVAISKAGRAIVYVDAPYSVTAAKHGQQLLRAMLHICQHSPNLQIEMYWIEDDSKDWCSDWVLALGEVELNDVAVPIGNGAIIWMEHGKVVQFQVGSKIESAYEITEITRKLWNSAD